MTYMIVFAIGFVGFCAGVWLYADRKHRINGLTAAFLGGLLMFAAVSLT